MLGQLENSDSPLYIACTQEANNDVDVVWDWNSPQAKQQPKRIYKRPIQSRSPKIPLKRHPSNTQVQNFDKLREELKNLKEAISVPDHEESLILSPVQEQEYKEINDFQNGGISPPPENFLTDDFFNDSINEKLVLFTQKAEAELCNLEQVRNQLFCGNNNTFSSVEKNANIEVSPIKHEDLPNGVKSDNTGFSSIRNTDDEIPNDSIDIALNAFKTESNDSFTEFFYNTFIEEKKIDEHTFSETKSVNQNKVTRQTTGKIEFHRTQSFESTLEHRNEKIPKAKLEEMERKRREALAKLELKKKALENSGTPTRCTPEEIEQKRRQALAKREIKRQQELIERKRKDALKRLELSRKKNATNIKSSLTKRL